MCIRDSLISDEGIQPNENKYASVSEFPTPKNLKDLRAFLGLAIQLGPRPSAHDKHTQTLAEERERVAMARRTQKSNQENKSSTNGKNNNTPVRPKEANYIANRRIKITRLGFRSHAGLRKRIPKADTVRIMLPNTDTTKICNDRARMPGYTKMRLLPKGITRFQNPD